MLEHRATVQEENKYAVVVFSASLPHAPSALYIDDASSINTVTATPHSQWEGQKRSKCVNNNTHNKSLV